MAVLESSHAAAAAVDDLYRRHAGEVYRYALAVLGQRADAEDVTQTTFLNAYRSLEQGVRPRKPSNWLLTIASNVIKQRLRSERARPRDTQLWDGVADKAADDDIPTVGELIAALGKIPPLQRQAIVLREFEGRSYREIAEILGVTTSALETLLFRARRALAEELESQLSCTEAQLTVSRATDGRLDRKERRRLRAHVAECPDCARFARIQQRNRRALRNLALIPIPVLEWPFRGAEAQAAAALATPTATAGLALAGGGGTAGVVGGGVAAKAAAVVTAASIAGGVGVAGGAQVETQAPKKNGVRVEAAERPGKRLGQIAPRGVAVPGRGIAVGRTGALPSAAKRAAPKTAKAMRVLPPRAGPKPKVERQAPASSSKPLKVPAKPERSEPRAKPLHAKSAEPHARGGGTPESGRGPNPAQALRRAEAPQRLGH